MPASLKFFAPINSQAPSWWQRIFALVLFISCFTVGSSTSVFAMPGSPNFPPGVPDVTNPATQLSVVANNAIADGASKNSIKVHIADASGNPVALQDVTFIINGGATGINPVLVTDINGDAVLDLSSTSVGIVSVTAKVNGNSIVFGSPALVTFVAGPPSVGAPTTVLSVVTNNATANGVATNSVKAHVTDALGNVVANASVTFTIATGTGTFTSPATMVTDVNGDAIIALNSTVAGSVNITATVNGTPIVNGSPATVIFIAGAPAVGNAATALSVIANNAVANGSANNTVKAHIVDAFGNPVPNATVVFSISSGTANFVGSATISTDVNGDAIINLNSTVAGSVNITATVNGVSITNGSPANVIFVPDVPSVAAPGTALSVVTNNAVANGSATNSVNAHIVDAFGNVVPNATVVFSISSGTANFVGSTTVTTNASGDATITLNSTVAGSVNITATVNGTPIINGSPATIVFVADVPSVSAPGTALSVVTNNAIADGSATNSVNAHIVDAFGNPVPNATIVFSLASGTANFVGSTTVTTNASGDAVIALNSTVAGNVSITATVNGNPIVNGSPAIVVFVAAAPSTANPSTALSVVTNNANADGVATNSVKAHIVDAFGNPVPNATIIFSISAGTANFVGSTTVITDVNGDATIALNSTVAGNVSITATVNGSPIVNGSPAVVTFVVNAPSTGVPTTALSVVTNNATADGIATNSVKAHITDAFGNPVPNATIIFTIASGTATFTTAATVTTDVNGDAVIALNSTVAGSVNITATVNGIPIINGSPATVQFVVGAPSTTAPGTALIVVTNNALADGVATNTVKAHITDASGNPVPNATVVFSIAAGTANFTGSTTITTDINGNATIALTSTVAGNVSVVATVNGSPITNGSPAIVTFVVNAPTTGVPTTTLSVVTDNALADGTATNSVKAHITDAFGNPVPNATIVFTIATGTANFVGSGTITTDVNGDAVIALNSNTVGIVTITATVNGSPIINGSPALVHFVIGSPAPSSPTTTLSVVTNNAVADGAATNTVKAHITDAMGNPVPNANIVFTIAAGSANFVGTSTLTTDINGDAVIALTSTVAGNVSITATVNGLPITNGSPAIVTFVVGAPSTGVPTTTLTVVTTNALADGIATNSVKAHITDAFGNPVPNASVTFSIANGTANFVGTSTINTDANGDAIITLNSTVAGPVDITATVSGTPITNGSLATVVFVSQPSISNPLTEIIVVTDNAVADNLATNSVKVHVVDQNGVPLAGQQIVFTILSGTATIITTQPLLTDANGEAIIQLVSKVAGQVSITATVNNVAILNGSPAVVRFTEVNIYVPKVFTPNADGNNDVLKPILVGISSFHYFSVYNRWGNLMYTTLDPNAGWDGRYKGVEQPVESYLWVAEGTNKNGERIVRKGIVSLVR